MSDVPHVEGCLGNHLGDCEVSGIVDPPAAPA